MTDEFVARVIDALLPGDDREPPLPSGDAAGVTRIVAARLRENDAIARAMAAIAREAGGEEAFTRATAEERVAAIAAVERAAPTEVRALVVLALETYYQSEQVIRAMSWRPQSPQPLGHPVEPLDLSLVEPVERRAPMWRRAESSDSGRPPTEGEGM